MQNLINFIEIPVNDFERAVNFYTAILGLPIEPQEMFGTQMGFFPTDGTNVSGALVKGDNYVPTKMGVVAYLNGGNDLNTVLEKITPAGGTVTVPKTKISDNAGCIAMFIDTEGNTMALHSAN
jgi:uncharacterized protein